MFDRLNTQPTLLLPTFWFPPHRIHPWWGSTATPPSTRSPIPTSQHCTLKTRPKLLQLTSCTLHTAMVMMVGNIAKCPSHTPVRGQDRQVPLPHTCDGAGSPGPLSHTCDGVGSPGPPPPDRQPHGRRKAPQREGCHGPHERMKRTHPRQTSRGRPFGHTLPACVCFKDIVRSGWRNCNTSVPGRWVTGEMKRPWSYS